MMMPQWDTKNVMNSGLGKASFVSGVSTAWKVPLKPQKYASSYAHCRRQTSATTDTTVAQSQSCIGSAFSQWMIFPTCTAQVMVNA